jgi:hypothetical protein
VVRLPTFVVLTEDGAKDARAVIVALLRRTLTQVVAPGCDTRSRVAFSAQDAAGVERIRPLLVGANWKGRSIDLRNLIQFIATELISGRVVLHHIDGDRPWSKAPGENAEKYEERVRRAVRRCLRERLSEADTEAHLARLVLWMPYYSVEAWLYQNLDEVERIAQGDAELMSLVAQWRARPAQLEEALKPKDLHPRLGSRHNLWLAEQGWPAARVFGLSLSYRSAVGALGVAGIGSL